MGTVTQHNRHLMLILVILLCLATNILALPSGAGGCDRNGRGSVASFGLHGSGEPGELADFGLRVVISETGSIDDGQVLNKDVPLSIEPQKSYTVFLDQTDLSRGNFRGFLFRAESPAGADISAAITPLESDLSQTAGRCMAPVAGVTHRFAAVESTVSRISVSLEFDDNHEGVLFDVTAVVFNRAVDSDEGRLQVSEFYWSPFVLNVKESVIPTPAPMETPAPMGVIAIPPPPESAQPTAPPTTAPSMTRETGRPIAPPPPTSNPTTTPTSSPSLSTSLPTNEPTAEPTLVPISGTTQPTESPEAGASGVGSEVPTSSPTSDATMDITDLSLAAIIALSSLAVLAR